MFAVKSLPDGQRCGPDDNFVEFQLRRQPVVGLALPLVRCIPLLVVVEVLQQTGKRESNIYEK